MQREHQVRLELDEQEISERRTDGTRVGPVAVRESEGQDAATGAGEAAVARRHGPWRLLVRPRATLHGAARARHAEAARTGVLRAHHQEPSVRPVRDRHRHILERQADTEADQVEEEDRQSAI